MIPHRLAKRFEPTPLQRLLYCGGESAFGHLVALSAQLQGVPEASIIAGTHPDTLVLRDTGESFRIGEDEEESSGTVRGLIHWAHQKPAAPYRIALLQNLERASRESPHALLKLIEEPPSRCLLLFTTKNPFLLLETIRSRMPLMMAPFEEEPLVESDAENFLRAPSLLERLRMVEALEAQHKKEKTRHGYTVFLHDCLNLCRRDSTKVHLLPGLLETYRRMIGNGNARLLCEALAYDIGDS